jgi:hypothetical protein
VEAAWAQGITGKVRNGFTLLEMFKIAAFFTLF